MTAHAERRGALTVELGGQGLHVLRDADGVTAALVLVDPRDPGASWVVAHQMAAAPTMADTLDEIEAICEGTPTQPFAEIARRCRKAIAAARAPERSEVDG